MAISDYDQSVLDAWGAEPYTSAQTVPQDNSAIDYGRFDTGPTWSERNLPSWLGGGVAPAYDASGNPTAAGLGVNAGTGPGGASGAGLAKALGQLGQGGAAKTPTGAGSQSAINMAQSAAYPSRGAAGLDALVRMLNARRDALLPQPVGISAAAQQRPSTGLLGF